MKLSLQRDPVSLRKKSSNGKMKNFNDQNVTFINIRLSHFNKKTKKNSRADPFHACPPKELLPDRGPLASVEAWKAQNFVDIMVKIHNKIQNIKS
jgi:hypothetical protein